MHRFKTMKIVARSTAMLAGVLLALLSGLLCAQAPATSAVPAEPEPYSRDSAAALEALGSFISLQSSLREEIQGLKKEIGAAQSDAHKERLKQQLDKVESNLLSVNRSFDQVAAGSDITILDSEKNKEFSLQQEIFALLKPAIDEMKEMTSHVRQKSELKERISYFDERLPVIERALDNIDQLLEKSTKRSTTNALTAAREKWQKQQVLMSSELQAAKLQLEELTAEEVSISEASQSYLKAFFHKRGLYLGIALLVVLVILLLSRLSHIALLRYAPGFRKTHRSFRVRLVELMHRIVTLLLVILGPMVVFYIAEDWVLFSISILLLLGLSLTLRHTIPHYLRQIQTFLNVGSVREGERITLDALPWIVREINFFCTLVNPVADLRQRVPINEIMNLRSRPARPDEPWFPCRRGDWVILGDGVRGKVIGISPEMVQLVERGGAQLTYLTADFLAESPRNLVKNFRIKETLGISYKLQGESTTKIPQLLHDYILEQARAEGLGEQLLNLRVEFERANVSSLDLVVIADFKGELGDLYNRLRRSVQRWSVDACSTFGWEIPFPQMTLHGDILDTTEATKNDDNKHDEA
jgi:hypothetical protein